MNEERTNSGRYKYVQVAEMLNVLQQEIDFAKQYKNEAVKPEFRAGYLQALEMSKCFLFKLQNLPR